MRRTLISGKRWIAFGAAAWLAGSGIVAPPNTHAAAPSPSASAPRSSHSVDNPFTGGAPAWPRPPARPASPLGPLSVAGDMVDAQTPALYRLPGASSFVPAPVESVVEQSVEQSKAAAPPAPAPAAIALRDCAADKAEASRPSSGEPLAEESPAPGAECPSTPWAAPQADDAESLPDESDVAATAGAVDSLAAVATGLAARPTTPPSTALTPQLLPSVQRGYALAQRGAMYAARAEFVQVLGRIAQSKDAATNSDAHSQALAAGLRAIDEAEDFVPDGVRVEAELDVRIVASSHRTPVLGTSPLEASPHEAVALYHRFAQEQLAAAVAGEQVGSMALHGLGKVSATLAERGSGDPALVRSATTMYSAALRACPSNHLASNELGVLLAREGRAGEAARLFEHTINMAPTATAYHNLSIAQAKLGFRGQSAANEQEAQRLAMIERSTGAVSRRAGVEWVTPEQMSGVPQPGLTPTAQVPPPRKSVWRKTIDIAKSPFRGTTQTR